MALLLIQMKNNYKIFSNRNYRMISNGKYFDKILIANRGEIACRIIKTAKKLGIKTVCVYSDADSKSKHVELSDESVNIGPTPAKDSYLNMNKLVEIAKNTKASAVHPGYGFLSENAEFVKLLEENNISFIGPSASVIQKMGDKLESKRIAIQAGVHTIPGYDGIIENEDHCLKIAENIGYPVMIKASAGGGGKGMRIADNYTQIKEGFKLSTQEALSSFGDGRILIEKFIPNPRHIEIQVLADEHGNVIHLGERECSIQRRNQKIIEEAPSSFLDVTLRNKMTLEAIKLCKQLNYTSAGTVEFLVDEKRNYYFLEMNTRLQVEHPVTEFITNIDIVEEMIKIAAGEKTIQQEDVKFKGWSMECRIYAEDPYKQFGTPSIGKIYKYIEPDFAGVRFDSGVSEGTEINVYYDPLISKLITYGATRSEAIHNQIMALDSYVICGVTTNIPLLRNILIEEKFQSGKLNTNYLKETYPEGFSGAELSNKAKNELVAMSLLIHAIMENVPMIVILDSKKYDVILLNKTDKKFTIQINNTQYIIEGKINTTSPVLEVRINDVPCIFQVLQKDGIGNIQLRYQGTIFHLRVMQGHVAKYLPFLNTKKQNESTRVVKSPMPGLIKSVLCKKGQSVTEGEELCYIEAMKMQNCIAAPMSGKIKDVYVKENEIVAELDAIIEFE